MYSNVHHNPDVKGTMLITGKVAVEEPRQEHLENKQVQQFQANPDRLQVWLLP